MSAVYAPRMVAVIERPLECGRKLTSFRMKLLDNVYIGKIKQYKLHIFQAQKALTATCSGYVLIRSAVCRAVEA